MMVCCGEGAATEVAQIRASLRAGLRRAYPSATPADLNDLTRTRQPVLCLLPPGFPAGAEDEPDLKKLREDYPHVTFVLWPGPSFEDGYVPGPAHATMVDPPVDTAREVVRHVGWMGIESLIGPPPDVGCRCLVGESE